MLLSLACPRLPRPPHPLWLANPEYSNPNHPNYVAPLALPPQGPMPDYAAAPLGWSTPSPVPPYTGEDVDAGSYSNLLVLMRAPLSVAPVRPLKR